MQYFDILAKICEIKFFGYNSFGLMFLCDNSSIIWRFESKLL